MSRARENAPEGRGRLIAPQGTAADGPPPEEPARTMGNGLGEESTKEVLATATRRA